MDFAVKMAETEGTRVAGDPVKTEKMEAMKKYRRIRVVKKYVGYVVVSATTAAVFWLLRWFPAVLGTVAPLLRHLCFVVIPGIGVLCGNHGFLFLLSNVIIMILAARSGLLSSSAGSSTADLYDEFVRKNESRPKYCIAEPVSQEKTGGEAIDHGDREDMKPKLYGRSKSEKTTSTVHQRRARKLKRADTSVDCNSRHKSNSSCEENSNCSNSSSSSSSLIVLQTDGNEPAMSDEELNRRVEKFIAEFKWQIRLQRQESFARYQEMVARGSK